MMQLLERSIEILIGINPNMFQLKEQCHHLRTFSVHNKKFSEIAVNLSET